MWFRIVARRVSALHHRARRLARADLALDRLERQRLVVSHSVHVHHPRAPGRRLHEAAVRDLPAALGVERALLELGEHPAVGALGHAQDGVRLGRLVAHEARLEAGLAGEAHHVLVLRVDLSATAGVGSRARARAAGARGLARALHQLLEPLVVHREALLGEQLLGHLVGEAEGVVQLEGVLRRDPGGAVRLRLCDQLVQQALALLERAAEALLLGARPALDRGPLALQIGVGVLHGVAHALAHAHEEGLVDAEHVPLLDRAAHDAAQHVAALLVRGHHAVGQQDRRAAAVVGDDPQRARGREVVAVLLARRAPLPTRSAG